MNIVFDFGGVLFDWEPPALVARVLPERVRSAADAQDLVRDIFQGFGGDWGAFDSGQVEPDVLAVRIAARTGLTAAQSRAVIDAVAPALRLNAHVTRLLHGLRARGHTLHYLSNMPEPYARYLERNHAIFDLFESGLFSSRVGLIKPQPEIFARAIDVFGASPRDTLLIDDVVRNVEAARDAGWQALRFEDADQCERALKRWALL